MTEKNPKCPYCGGLNTISHHNSWYCRDCSAEFGRDALNDDGIPMKDAMSGLRFSYGSVVSGSMSIRFVWDEDGQSCLYEVYQAKDGVIRKQADLIDAQKWNQIKDTLIDKLYVCDWQNTYYPPTDGSPYNPDHEWRLDLLEKDGQEKIFRGYDSFPPYFNDLQKIFRPYIRKLDEKQYSYGISDACTSEDND